MKNYLLLFIMLAFLACNSEQKANSSKVKNESSSVALNTDTTSFKVFVVDKNDKAIHDSIKGTKINELSWRDAEGEHRVLFTAIPVQVNGMDLQSAAIYAYCFIKNADGWKKKWVVKDRTESCPVDATCEFLPGSFTVTDNDSNNLGEVTFIYKLSCKGDVSPDEKKLIMYEGLNKYAIRGTTIIKYAGKVEGGEKKVDVSLTTAAKPLLDFANSQWDKFGSTIY